MYKKILVPMALDHDISGTTLAVAKTLTGGDGDITALHVHEAAPATARATLDDDLLNTAFQRATEEMRRKTEHLEGVTAKLVTGHTYRTIIDYAVENGVDCIVMGSHKPGLSDYLLGSTAARVVRHAPCAVHVVRED